MVLPHPTLFYHLPRTVDTRNSAFHCPAVYLQARVCVLVQENMTLISSIRENMVMGRFFDNHSLMIAFDKNVKEVTALLATLPFADMQKLPVQVSKRPRAIPAVPRAGSLRDERRDDSPFDNRSLSCGLCCFTPTARFSRLRMKAA